MEDFIKHSATKSKLSEIVYKIHCAGKHVVKSHQWLLTELMVFRNIDK